ncbi:iron complex transport system substrate-binding protein [Deinococcus soli (ex Cha et al. 2016)]|uniref:Iron complex transport system substrate-binding protein n=3 Tax=Deinococcus soli (ex Cha et al. 2016) TaxID=1309411 RepID=A0AAE3XDZ2_9DEIO|nr:iron complex transport system substrate-binding protein [Deinococcus soli (ex Cha et al. 2016)]MDR6330040.1 iron complex transport system substrate-binding protein [Deinococcus soli (ex Cha et al. 2016)]MDR6753329.1 iron complex transport system substrate-binding protein [Deinococcus soli (ex Cha et al. 2016)]GGB66588.1 ABC transporter substrate-binding protein [Deinococcus soli (ex Cha et al. 2016)]
MTFPMKGILTLITLSGALSGAAAATSYPLTITDDLGRKVTLKAEPKRIVSVLPSTSETVCALGLCDRLVGVDDYSDYPQQVTKLPKVGGLYNPNIEAMVALKPDVVLVSQYGKLAEPLTQAGVTVIAVNPETYDEVFSKTLLLGKILNREAQAKTLVGKIKGDIARVEILTKNAVRKPTAYFEIDPTPYSIGPNSFMGVLLTKAGARNIIPASMGDFPKVDPEFIVKANPQLILGVDAKTAGARPGWSGISALKTGKVRDIPAELNTMLGRPGPRLGQALMGLAKLIHPELFR